MVLAVVVPAAALSWVQGSGHDLVDRVRGTPAIEARAYLEPSWTRLALRNRVTSPEDVAALAFDGATDAVLQRLGPVRVETLDVRIQLTGRRTKLQVLDLRVRPRRPPAPPVTGALLVQSPQGASETRRMTADLDRSPVVFTERGKPGVRFFDGRAISLKRGEAEVLAINVTTRKQSHEFDLVLVYSDDGGDFQELVITAPGDEPFRVTGLASTYAQYGGVYFQRGTGYSRMKEEETCDVLPATRGC